MAGKGEFNVWAEGIDALSKLSVSKDGAPPDEITISTQTLDAMIKELINIRTKMTPEIESEYPAGKPVSSLAC